MAKLNFLFSTFFWGASSSIPVMKMLAQQAEDNITRAVSEEVISKISDSGEFEDDAYDEFGHCTGTRIRDWYSCGSCIGHDLEVISEYKHLITQLTRRSAYLTMFGIFEHRIIECLQLMAELTGTAIEKKPSIEICHDLLTKEIGGAGITDVDHLTVIRNIMAHSDGIAEDYHGFSASNTKLKHSQKRLVRELRRAQKANCGISITMFNNVIMDENFLGYAISEFEQYIAKLETAVRTYHNKLDLK